MLVTSGMMAEFGRAPGHVQDKRRQVHSRTRWSRIRDPARRCIRMLMLSSQKTQSTAVAKMRMVMSKM